MKPIKFKEENKNLLKPQNMTDEECSSLWVYTDGEQCISCWKMNWKQRIMALLFRSCLAFCSFWTDTASRLG